MYLNYSNLVLLQIFPFLCLLVQDKVYGEASTIKNINGRIIGGQESYVGQFPSAAALYVQTNTSQFFCGGTLYNQAWVITSANCLYNAVLVTVQVGSNKLEGTDNNREVAASSQFFLHPDFNPDTIENDIALLKVRMTFTYTLYVQPSFLPEKEVDDGTAVTSIGWGQTSDLSSQTPNTLMHVDTVVLSNTECRTIYGNQIVDNMACATGNYNKGTCIGDNGGPLLEYAMLHFHYIVGVASFISGNGCESTDPSGYTRVFPYVDWIRNVTRNN